MNFESVSNAQLKIVKQGLAAHSNMSPLFGGYGSVTLFAGDIIHQTMHDYREPHQIELLAHHGFMPVHSHYQPVRGPKNA
ncbi:hypothetical protein vBVpP1_48 [Vibrio phage vB_VpP_1]|nr:hypothetical protein vBVpP1_48 [Vibrio phage vB_VpP_1]